MIIFFKIILIASWTRFEFLDDIRIKIKIKKEMRDIVPNFINYYVQCASTKKISSMLTVPSSLASAGPPDSPQ